MHMRWLSPLWRVAGIWAAVFVLAEQWEALALAGGLSLLLNQQLLALNSQRTQMPFLYQADLMSHALEKTDA